MSVPLGEQSGSDILLARVEPLLMREGGTIMDAYVTLDLILTEDVPVDHAHVAELAQAMRKEQLNTSGEGTSGQVSAITLAHVPRMPKFLIIDGFHRTGALNQNGEQKAYASICLNSTLEETFDRRITAATSHKSVQFARVVDWVEAAWSRTDWHRKGLSVSQGFMLGLSDSNNGARLGLSPNEVRAITQWTKAKSQQWNMTTSQLHNNLVVAGVMDPKLVREVRASKANRANFALSPQHLKVIGTQLPHLYLQQNLVAKVILQRKMSAADAQQLVSAVASAPTPEAAVTVIETGSWTNTLPPARPSRPQPSKQSTEPSNPIGKVDVDGANQSIKAMGEEIAALRNNGEAHATLFIEHELLIAKLALENTALRKELGTSADRIRVSLPELEPEEKGILYSLFQGKNQAERTDIVTQIAFGDTPQ
ncbi:MAG: hypothetical protein JWM81_871 [Candidatus Saccharibacteria bacterium]|nr:hypothetical protein [Candidatus Saccharibacteria bacterium]